VPALVPGLGGAGEQLGFIAAPRHDQSLPSACSAASTLA
jgi:hypothetical protein